MGTHDVWLLPGMPSGVRKHFDDNPFCAVAFRVHVEADIEGFRAKAVVEVVSVLSTYSGA